jgi:predicted N-formylglutamate amidohydrolase
VNPPTEGAEDPAAVDPPAFRVERPAGASPFFLTCDHASQRLPARLGTLGLSEEELGRHIAWDLGIAGVARRLSARLDAFLIEQGTSRLAIDANRPPGAPDSIVSRSDGTSIPGNQGLSPEEVARRVREIFRPYHDRIAEALDERDRAGRITVLVTLHSFTPSLDGVARPWHAGVLYQRDPRLAHRLLALLRAEPGLVVGDNQPYAASDATDYTLVVHGERRGLPHVELELRQDLISDEAGQALWAARLAVLLERAFGDMFPR